MIRKRKDVISLYTESDDGEESLMEIPDLTNLPETQLERTELVEAVNSGLLQLGEDYRKALVLRELGGQSYDEIAKTLSLDIGTVKSRIHRARKKLCQILSENGNIFDKSSSLNSEGRCGE